MGNSKAYDYIVKQMKATGREKLDGYDERAFDGLTDDERNIIEDKIWRRYKFGFDDGLAVYLPKLRKHDGISALRKKLLKEKSVESRVFLADILYRATMNESYFQIFRDCCNNENGRLRVAVVLQDYPKGAITKEILKEIFIQSDYGPTQITAVKGILYQVGCLHSVNNLKKEELDYCRQFCVKDGSERRALIENLMKENC